MAHVCGVALQSARIQELEHRYKEAVEERDKVDFTRSQLHATINKWRRQIEELAFKYISLCQTCMELHETDKGFSCETCHEFLCDTDAQRCDTYECNRVMCGRCAYRCEDEDCTKRFCSACDDLLCPDGQVGLFCREHQKE